MEPRGPMLHSHGLSILIRSIQFLISTNISLKHFLILPSHECISLPRDLFSVDLPVKMLKTLLTSPILATCSVHLNPMHLITLIILGEMYKLWSSPLWILHHFALLSLLDPRTRLRIWLLNTLSVNSLP